MSMVGLRITGLLVASALANAMLQYLSRQYGGVVPIPFAGLLLAVAAVGLPSWGTSVLAGRLGLWQPRLLAIIGFCLGCGIATAIIDGGGVATALINAATLTVYVPSTSAVFWGNLLWLVMAYLFAQDPPTRKPQSPSP